MMNDREMLKNIEYLRERSDVSYEEAQELLTRFDGNLMRVLVELERQGRIRPQNSGKTTATAHKAAPKEPGFWSKALRYRVVAEDPKRKTGDKPEVIINLSAVFCAAVLLFAPHLAVGSLVLSFILGYHIRIAKRKAASMPSDLDSFVDQAVSNIHSAASSFAKTAREAAHGNAPESEAESDENEITVE